MTGNTKADLSDNVPKVGDKVVKNTNTVCALMSLTA